MKAKRSLLRNQFGLSLIELVVAFAILATAASSLLLLSSTTSQGNTRSKEHAAAASLGVGKIEELKNLPFSEIASGADGGTLDAGGEANGTFTRSWAVTTTTVSGVPAKNVTVTVNGAPNILVALTTTIIDPPMVAADYDGFPTVLSKGWSQR
jgi:Tfp pilus assembly protein PilV